MKKLNKTKNLELVNSAIQKEHYRVAMTVLSVKGGRWEFNANQWVPTEYEHLERLGLVYCEFASSNDFYPKRQDRTIILTAAGKLALQQMEGCLMNPPIPLNVSYSFRSTLENWRIKQNCANQESESLPIKSPSP